MGLRPPPRAQAPLISYNLIIDLPLSTHHPVAHDFLAAIGPKRTLCSLRSLRIANPLSSNCTVVSFSQLSANFKDLVSLSLENLVLRSTEELTLPRLERLAITAFPEDPPLPTQGWNLPRLRHVSFEVDHSPTYFDALLTFLRRYGSQLESLFLIQFGSPINLPHNFWDSFSALRLLGGWSEVLKDHIWSGWAITPPRAHPLRYLACIATHDVDATIDSLRSTWTYHEKVA